METCPTTSIERLLLRRFAAALAQADGLADAVAEVVKLRTSGNAAALHDDLADLGRVDREFTLHAFALHDAADGERLAAAAAGTGDDHAGVDLHAFLLTFENAAVNVDRVADLELGNLFFEARLLDNAQ